MPRDPEALSKGAARNPFNNYQAIILSFKVSITEITTANH
jgi:hypothetical protein